VVEDSFFMGYDAASLPVVSKEYSVTSSMVYRSWTLNKETYVPLKFRDPITQ
jgi:hypothetical protein